MKKRIKLKQYLTRLLLFLLLLQCCIFAAFNWMSIANYRDNEKTTLRHINAIHSDDLEKIMKRSDASLEDILIQQQMLHMLGENSELKRWHSSRTSLELLNSKIEAGEQADLYIIAEKKNKIDLIARNGNIFYPELEGITQFVFSQFERLNGDSNWFCHKIRGKNYLIHYYKCYDHIIAAAVISEQQLLELFSDGDSNTYKYKISDKDNKHLIFNAEYDWDHASFLDIQETCDIYDGALKLQTVWRSSGLSNERDGIIAIMGLIVILLSTSLISVWIFRCFVIREIINPLDEMVAVTNTVKDGNWMEKAALSSSNQEFNHLEKTYNAMLDTITKLKMERYERVIRMKTLELKYLHMQLKPHFFLNVLSSINSLSYQHKEDEIRMYIQALSANLRYMFRTGLHTVALEDEISYIDNYLEIQRLLYKDCFYFYIDVEDDAKKWPIPQMLLHTFAENVFKHVINVNSFTTVFLQCAIEEKNGKRMLKIEMENDNVQFPEEVITRFCKEDAPEMDYKTGTGVGLSNIKKVLYYMYEQTDLVELKNENGQAVLQVFVPEHCVKKEGENESADC